MFSIGRINSRLFGSNRYFSSLQPGKQRRTRLTWKAYAILVCPMTCFGLGYWQIKRRRWKLDLIAKLENNIHSSPVTLPSSAMASEDLSEYVPVTIRGRFDHSREVYIGPRCLVLDFITSGGPGSEWIRGSNRNPFNPSRPGAPISAPGGYFVVTPFFLADRPGVSILVNRGWVPTDACDPSTRLDGQIHGTVELTGFIRYSEGRPLLSPEPRVEESVEKNRIPRVQYFWRNIGEISKFLGTLPLMVEANYESSIPGGPVGGQTRVQQRNEHASYIFTWMSLGTIGSVMWAYFFVI